MSTISASEARRRLFPLIVQVNQDRTEVRITSKGGNAVLVSEAEFEAWQTTRHLYSTRANAEHLEASIEEALRGERIDQPLDQR
jgi:antitoxin YefM